MQGLDLRRVQEMLLLGSYGMPSGAGQRHAALHLGHLQELPLTERFEMGSGSGLLGAALLAPYPQQTGQHPQCHPKGPWECLVTLGASVANLPALTDRHSSVSSINAVQLGVKPAYIQPKCRLGRLVTLCASVANLRALRHVHVRITNHCCASVSICQHTVYLSKHID